MNNPMREMYINVLEKRAAAAPDAVSPDYGIDSQEVANREAAANASDQRAQIKPLLDAATATEKATTKQVGQLLPIAKKTPGTAASNALLKVAMHEAFFSGVRQTDLLKTAELDYLRTAFQGFEDEMGKMGSAIGEMVEGAAKRLGRSGGGSKPISLVKPKVFPSGSVVRKLPASRAGGRMSRGAVEKSLSQVPKHTSPLTSSEAARFSKAPKQVGSGVWKLAQANAVANFASANHPAYR